MKRATKLTEEEHRAIGECLKRQYVELMELHLNVERRYGKTSKMARKTERAVKANTLLRNEMDNQLFRDYPDIENFQGVYYGPPAEEKKE